MGMKVTPAQRHRDLRPLLRNELLERENEPARETPPADRLLPPGARTFSLVGGGQPRIVPARHGAGWAIETETQILGGLAGEDFRADDVARTAVDGRDWGRIAPACIPPWAGRGYHPTLCPIPKARRRIRRGKIVREHDKTVHIFDGDSRVPVYPNSFPLRCVCKLYIYTQSRANGFWDYQSEATGFMVGPRLVMTSGHARPKAPYFAWKIKVVPAFFSSSSLLGPGFFTFAQYHLPYQSDSGNDLMLLKLYDDLGTVTGWFGAISYDGAWGDEPWFSMCGYPWDIVGATIPCLETGIAVEDDDDGDDIKLPNGKSYDTTQIETRADTASGMSGSPLYSWFTDGNTYAIGVNHGTEEDFGWDGYDLHEVASGGDGFVALVNWGRANWA